MSAINHSVPPMGWIPNKTNQLPAVSGGFQASAGGHRFFPDLQSLITQQSEDLFEQPAGSVAKRATTLFSAGFLMSLAGGFIVKGLRKPAPLQGNEGELLGDIPKEKARKAGVLNRDIFGMYQEKFLAFFKLLLDEPGQRNAFFAYIGVSLLGYVSGSLLRGLQEAWVRLEETRIRARLLERLTGVVQESIRTKQELDNQLRLEAGRRIQEILLQSGVPPCEFLLEPKPLPESLLVNSQYLVQPTHRTVHFGKVSEDKQVGGAFWKLQPWEVMSFGGGAVLGLLVHGFFKLIKKTADGRRENVIKTVTENITLLDQEYQFSRGVRQSKWILLGMYGMTALMKVGKLWFDGLREIEVTRLNASTEYRYQRNNWLTLDPRFHQIAEVEALDNDLRQLQQDLRYLRWNRPLLDQRIQTILINIGLRSAPKYFPMIPMVGLREARS